MALRFGALALGISLLSARAVTAQRVMTLTRNDINLYTLDFSFGTGVVSGDGPLQQPLTVALSVATSEIVLNPSCNGSFVRNRTFCEAYSGHWNHTIGAVVKSSNSRVLFSSRRNPRVKWGGHAFTETITIPNNGGFIGQSCT
jgi:hypothetical protein